MSVSERPVGLPNYQNPPIDELAIGVQFPPIENFHDAHAGLYWPKVRMAYPRVENQPRVEGPIESRDQGLVPTFPIQFPLAAPSQSRTWLISQDDEHLIQIQNTRFLQNWRRRGAQYPHFEKIWNLFQDHYEEFKRLLESERLAQPIVQQVEITYINWIADLLPSRFLKSGAGAGIIAHGRQVEPESQALSARYRIDAEDEVIERLYVQCQPAIKPQEQDSKGTALIFTYKAAKADGFSEDQIEFYAQSGRFIIVNAFTDLTTPEAHEIWGPIE
jgi:uncharacterized protein (TIGR04255 family)